MVRVRTMVDDDAKYIVDFNQGTDENFLHQWAGGRFYTYPITSEQIIARIKNTNNTRLAEVARAEALRPFHGTLSDKKPNIKPIVVLFPKWSVEQADRNWCAGFVYYCCVKAGFLIPYSPDECVSCSLAGCGGWEDFALGDKRIEYHIGSDEIFTPDAGDIVLFDRVFNNLEHDHIGIVLENKPNTIIVAEGNCDNISRILERNKDEHIRAYIRIPDRFSYYEKKL